MMYKLKKETVTKEKRNAYSEFAKHPSMGEKQE